VKPYCWSSEELDQAARAIVFRANRVVVGICFFAVLLVNEIITAFLGPLPPASTSNVETVHTPRWRNHTRVRRLARGGRASAEKRTCAVLKQRPTSRRRG